MVRLSKLALIVTVLATLTTANAVTLSNNQETSRKIEYKNSPTIGIKSSIKSAQNGSINPRSNTSGMVTRANNKKATQGNFKLVKAEVTAYVLSGSYGYTANGTKVYKNSKSISAPPSIRYGTIIEVEGYGIAKVLDRGSAVKVKPDGTIILDILLPSYNEAIKWGRKKMMVKVYDKEVTK